MTSWTRAATTATQRTTVRAKRARQRVRSSATTTGEFKKIDITESPDRKPRDLDISESPDRFVQEETVTRG